MWSIAETLIFVPLVGVVSPVDIISSLRLMDPCRDPVHERGGHVVDRINPPTIPEKQTTPAPIAFRGFGDGRLEISQDEGVLATMYATRVLLKRSVWKGPHLVPLPIVWPKSPGDKVPPVRTQARSATILPNFVGLKFEVHNGKDYHEVTITEDMVGHKLGEFSPTRKPNIWDKR